MLWVPHPGAARANLQILYSNENGVILSAAKNPEGDGGVYDADIVWILHFGRRRDLRSE